MRVMQFPLLHQIKEGKGNRIKKKIEKIEKKDFKSYLKSVIHNPKESKFFFLSSNFSINPILVNKGKLNLKRVLYDIKKESCIGNSQKKIKKIFLLKQKEKLMHLYKKSNKKSANDFSGFIMVSPLSPEKNLVGKSIPKVISLIKEENEGKEPQKSNPQEKKDFRSKKRNP